MRQMEAGTMRNGQSIKKGFGNACAVMFLLSQLMFLYGFILMNGVETTDGIGEKIIGIVIIILSVILIFVNLGWVLYHTIEGIESKWLLMWNMVIRLLYLPVVVYIVISALAGIVMIMFGGIIMLVLAFLGMLCVLLPPAIYGICGCIQLVREQKLSKAMAVLAGALQFILGIDTIVAVVLFFKARKEINKSM